MDTGEALRQMADVKDSLDISVKHNFIDPLQTVQDKDLREITVCCCLIYRLVINSWCHSFNSWEEMGEL